MKEVASLAHILVDATIDFVRYTGERIRVLEPAMTDPAGADAEALFTGACDDIQSWIAPVLENGFAHRIARPVVQQFCYFLAAWADEYVIHVLGDRVPPGALAAIEARLFGTREAGERVFVMVDRLLAERSEAGELLLPSVSWIFALGFTGQYGDDTDDSGLRRYRDRLGPYQLVSEGGAAPGYREPERDRPRRRYSAFIWCLTLAVWLVVMCACSWKFVGTPDTGRFAPQATGQASSEEPGLTPELAAPRPVGAGQLGGPGTTFLMERRP